MVRMHMEGMALPEIGLSFWYCRSEIIVYTSHAFIPSYSSWYDWSQMCLSTLALSTAKVRLGGHGLVRVLADTRLADAKLFTPHPGRRIFSSMNDWYVVIKFGNGMVVMM